MSKLTAQIAGVNLWHGMSRPQAALLCLKARRVERRGEELGGAEAGATGLTPSPAV